MISRNVKAQENVYESKSTLDFSITQNRWKKITRWKKKLRLKTEKDLMRRQKQKRNNQQVLKKEVRAKMTHTPFRETSRAMKVKHSVQVGRIESQKRKMSFCKLWRKNEIKTNKHSHSQCIKNESLIQSDFGFAQKCCSVVTIIHFC